MVALVLNLGTQNFVLEYHININFGSFWQKTYFYFCFYVYLNTVSHDSLLNSEFIKIQKTKNKKSPTNTHSNIFSKTFPLCLLKHGIKMGNVAMFWGYECHRNLRESSHSLQFMKGF